LSIQPLSQNRVDPADLSSYKFDATDRGRKNSGEQAGPRVEDHSLHTIEGEGASRLARHFVRSTGLEFCRTSKELSPWSRSGVKRIFDCACVLISLPILLPVMLATAVAVRLTSAGPVLFLQKRVGREGRAFTIFKFRTMVHRSDRAQNAITTSDDRRVTLVGAFLRRWKLDELPQLINVLLGQMSLVGPRPKVPEHVMFNPPCRPGITGLATIVFACEESVLAGMDGERLDAYYHTVVLPAKRQLDAMYMSRATFSSDLRLLVNSVLRRWNSAALDELMVSTALGVERAAVWPKSAAVPSNIMRMPMAPTTGRQIEAEEVSAG
jgi:lipopolysaccharide/colanic/teichoic acid biosynthesis glycosyltransferase